MCCEKTGIELKDLEDLIVEMVKDGDINVIIDKYTVKFKKKK